MKIELDNIYNMDCLEGMKYIPDGSVDAIICDLPYGTTANKWDSVIPFDKLWEQYKRIRKPHAPILLFGSEPFSTNLRMSNMKEFRYDWIWEKSRVGGFVNAKNKPMKNFEIVSAFCQYPAGHESMLGERRMPYYPQGLVKCNKVCHDTKRVGQAITVRPTESGAYVQEYTNYPTAILKFSSEVEGFHPTQKPVDLLRYLVLTYTNAGDPVLDNCIGSGTTAIACIREHRHFIGFEMDKVYYKKSIQRINNEKTVLRLF